MTETEYEFMKPRIIEPHSIVYLHEEDYSDILAESKERMRNTEIERTATIEGIKRFLENICE